MTVRPSYEEAVEILKALAHPARLQIVDTLRIRDACVCHFETLLDRPQAYVSQQLGVLRSVGLVSDCKEGQRVYYSLADERVRDLLEVLLGPPRGEETLEACRCPECQTMAVARLP